VHVYQGECAEKGNMCAAEEGVYVVGCDRSAEENEDCGEERSRSERSEKEREEGRLYGRVSKNGTI
jgi:hypothetical protein